MTGTTAKSARPAPVVLVPNSSGMGGMEAHLVQLAGGLRQRGIPVAAICEPRPELQALRDGLVDAGAAVHTISARDGSVVGVVRRTLLLIKTIRRYPRCVVHMHYGGYGGGELVQLAARLGGASAVIRTEHVPPIPPITRTRRALVRLRDHFLSKVICVSEQNRQEHLTSLGRDARRCIVVHNGVDLDRFSPAISGAGVAREFGFGDDIPIVGTVGRLVEERKGIGDFLAMCAAVRRSHPSARFLIIGDGSQRPRFEARARELGLSDVVVFTGSRDDVPRLLAAMSVFVMPSLWEGCQYSLLEAMAMARPIVSTPAGVAPVVVRDRATGLLVPFADPDALARGVLELLADPDLAAGLGRAGREVIATSFSQDAMVETLIAVYQAAVAGSGRQPVLDLRATTGQRSAPSVTRGGGGR